MIVSAGLRFCLHYQSGELVKIELAITIEVAL